jgi:hypothetical protein
MKRISVRATSVLPVILGLIMLSELSVAQTPAAAPAPDPGITLYMYRRVPADKREEFIKRETTYWSEVARKALSKGNITFWALLEKVGGYDMENSSNFLFVNTYKNVDAIGEVWNSATAAFPNVPMEKMETNSISTTTSMFFLRSEGWQEAAGVVADKEFKYISMVYHNASDPSALIELENKHWGPFVKSAMDKKQTTMRGWGNARVLSPSGENIRFNTVSYDLYPSLKEALMPTWDPKTVFPEAGLEEINKLEINRRGGVVYEIIKVVSGN